MWWAQTFCNNLTSPLREIPTLAAEKHWSKETKELILSLEISIIISERKNILLLFQCSEVQSGFKDTLRRNQLRKRWGKRITSVANAEAELQSVRRSACISICALMRLLKTRLLCLPFQNSCRMRKKKEVPTADPGCKEDDLKALLYV